MAVVIGYFSGNVECYIPYGYCGESSLSYEVNNECDSFLYILQHKIDWNLLAIHL